MQEEWRQIVDNLFIKGVFTKDFFLEDQNAFNVFRLDLVSAESGVSQRVYDLKGTPNDKSDDTIVSTTMKNTALKYIFSGVWAHCWMERSPQTAGLRNNILNTYVPDWDYYVIILNESRGGGYGGGGAQIVTKKNHATTGWRTLAHEFGHGIGGLADEYSKIDKDYPRGEPSAVNCTKNTNRATLKWKKYVKSSTPIPTSLPRPAGWDSAEDAGLFKGCATYKRKVYRSVNSGRMRSNAPPFGPVGYNHMKLRLDPFMKHTFFRTYVGDFTGDGKDDIVVHNDDDIALYKSVSRKLERIWIGNNRVSGWQFKPGDRFYVGDFNNDGKDDLLVFNGADWSMEYLGVLLSNGQGFSRSARYDDRMRGWQFKRNDRFYVGDFSGDGKDDVVVYNSTNWSKEYLGMLRSTGRALRLVKRYDDRMPGWQFQKHDRFYFSDFSGDGKKDLIVLNTRNWSKGYLGMLRSNGQSLTLAKRYDDVLPGWRMRRHDRLYIGDFNKDGKEDAYIFNGRNWRIAYLGMLRSLGNRFTMAKRYDGSVPGWKMRSRDRFAVGDVNGDRRADLFVFNTRNWSTQYLGVMRSSGSRVSASWQKNRIGQWNLGRGDYIRPANYRGGANRKPDLIIFNRNWLGMLHYGSRGFRMDNLYRRWIHNEKHGRWWYQ